MTDLIPEREKGAGDIFIHVTPKDGCVHKWDGPDVDIENGSSRTCSKCGTDAFSWSMRYLP